MFAADLIPFLLIVLIVFALSSIRSRRRWRRTQEELTRLSMLDRLTGLHDRVALFDRAETLFTARADVPVAVLVADIDELSKLNDQYGYVAGDDAIRAFGRALASIVAHVPGADERIVGRLDGDAFAVVVVGLDHKRASRLAEDIAAQARRITQVRAGTVLTTSVTVGLAMRTAGQDFDDVLRAAERVIEESRDRDRARQRAPVHTLIEPTPQLTGDRAVHALRTATRMAYHAQRLGDPSDRPALRLNTELRRSARS